MMLIIVRRCMYEYDIKYFFIYVYYYSLVYVEFNLRVVLENG